MANSKKLRRLIFTLPCAPHDTRNQAGKGDMMVLLNRMLSSPKVWPLCLALVLAVSALYGGFLKNPIVFDDVDFLDNADTLRQFGSTFFHFNLRWLPYSSFGWTYNLFGLDVFWMRLGNLLLHAANAIVLFIFLRVLFNELLVNRAAAVVSPHVLSGTWLAFFAALIFALHPVAVYSVAYLVQRSILMATLFSLLTLLAYLQGLIQNKPVLFAVAAAFYFLAVFSKEHSIMVPGVALALTFLLRKPSRELFKKFLLPFFAVLATVGVAIALKSKGVVGSPYEPWAKEMFLQLAESRGSNDIADAYFLSVLTQLFLFFKYLALWIIPNPEWMSIDMREPFAAGLISWPHTLGWAGFTLHGVVGARLLFARGRKSLLGFALLFPWVLFMTELSSVRIQEQFVLYRSYLWAGGMLAALPLLFGKLGAKPAFALLLAASALLFALSWNRLVTFSDPLLLWDDAEKLVHGKTNLPGIDRIYYNRGTYYGKAGLRLQAINDFTKAIEISPRNVVAYGNRAAAYFEEGRFYEALLDFEKTIAMDPKNERAYLGRGLSYEALGMGNIALPDFAKSCELGLEWACNKHYQSLHGASR